MNWLCVFCGIFILIKLKFIVAYSHFPFRSKYIFPTIERFCFVLFIFHILLCLTKFNGVGVIVVVVVSRTRTQEKKTKELKVHTILTSWIPINF